MKASRDAISTPGGLDIGAYPSDHVLCGYEQFMCQPFNLTAVMAMQVKRHMLKQLKQGVEKVFPIVGVIIQYIMRAHYQTYIWAQDTVADSTMLDPVGLG